MIFENIQGESQRVIACEYATDLQTLNNSFKSLERHLCNTILMRLTCAKIYYALAGICHICRDKQEEPKYSWHGSLKYDAYCEKLQLDC